jgi:hypothetical protein
MSVSSSAPKRRSARLRLFGEGCGTHAGEHPRALVGYRSGRGSDPDA